jgi:hypothetical protein
MMVMCTLTRRSRQVPAVWHTFRVGRLYFAYLEGCFCIHARFKRQIMASKYVDLYIVL